MFDKNQPSYQTFRAIVSERSRPVIAWTGAGLSAPAGIPTWGDLRSRLTDAARRQAQAKPDSKIRDRDLRAIESISSIDSHWTAFSRLKDVMGVPLFVSQIRGELTPADDTIPRNYVSLWNIHLRGLITLNLDRLASRSFSEARPGRPVAVIDSGRSSGNYASVLQSPTPWILNAHGVVDNADSWVFTQNDIDTLLSTDAYRTFINSVVATSTILFIGITADDVASGGFLSRMVQSGFKTSEHFWLTNRSDDATSSYASAAGIHPIYYSSANGHDAPLTSFFDDIKQFRSKDDTPPPVRHSSAIVSSRHLDPSGAPNDIRLGLATLVLEALDTTDPIQELKLLHRKHAREIHAAWFVSDSPPNNEFFSYTVDSKIGDGGFGKVYLAHNANNEKVAIKVLRQEILDNDDLVGSFRRGVRSMEILSRRNVAGMVKFLDAFELPPTVVMEYIHGENIQQLKERGELNCIEDVLRIAIEVAQIVHNGHTLPERVLHRDIRPANVMIKHQITDRGDVVVLDFDLSWHRGSNERSIDLSSVATIGYLAPELINKGPGRSTRSTAVDVFGLAMTMYYMMSGRHPPPGSIHSPDWARTIEEVVAPYARPLRWKSTGRRLQRLIRACTLDKQGLRPDMPAMISELMRIDKTVRDPNDVTSAELLAEELAVRASDGRDCHWDENKLGCNIQLASGLSINLKPIEFSGSIDMDISYVEKGSAERRNVRKYVDDRRKEATSLLRNAGWQITSEGREAASLRICASISVSSLSTAMDSASASLSKVMERFSLE